MSRFNKVSGFACLIFLTGFFCFARNSTSRFKFAESVEEFDVAYFVTDEMEEIDSKLDTEVSITQAFKVKKDSLKGEIRYSLFTDTSVDDLDLEIQYVTWVFMCLYNVAGYEVSGDLISNFKVDDVKAEFNGDFGCTAFIKKPDSSYAKGYEYLMVEFFYKEMQGLVMRTFLFNDPAFAGMSKKGFNPDCPLYSNYHTFRFMEKDENGKYIDP